MAAKRIRHHVNPLALQYLDFDPAPLPDLSSASVVEVELGCAEGDFLFDRVRDTSGDVLIVGLEIRRKLVDRINEKAARMGLAHRLVAVFANLNVHIPEIFPPASVDRFFFNFPDPWFKNSQKKRRVVSRQVVEELIKALKPGGQILFQSDVFDIALDAMYSFEAFGCPPLVNESGEWSFIRHNPFGTMSRRERHVTEDGTRVWRILYSLPS